MKKKNKQKLLLSLCAAAFIIGVALIFIGNLTACNDESNKIEIVEEPQITLGTLYNNAYYPIISVKVKNKTDSTINVAIDCSIYDTDGKLTQKISSLYFGIAPDETATLWAKSNSTYTSWEYSKKCAEFEVEYKFLND